LGSPEVATDRKLTRYKDPGQQRAVLAHRGLTSVVDTFCVAVPSFESLIAPTLAKELEPFGMTARVHSAGAGAAHVFIEFERVLGDE